MPRSTQRRRTPWDSKGARFPRRGAPGRFGRGVLPESGAARAGRKAVFWLHGLYVFDPDRATSEDLRQFMWTGLRVLRTQARVRGLSEDQIRHLLMSAFEVFHDAAESMWITLKRVVSKEPSTLPCGPVSTTIPPYIACEEDRPVPVEMDYREPLTLLDPDDELLFSSER